MSRKAVVAAGPSLWDHIEDIDDVAVDQVALPPVENIQPNIDAGLEVVTEANPSILWGEPVPASAPVVVGIFKDVEGFDPDAKPTLHGFDLLGKVIPPDPKAKLQQQFLVPPFSVLDARQGYWQDRKAAWIALGIKSELGRGPGTWVESDETGSPMDRQQSYKDASPGGSARPACDYSKGERGDGSGKPIEGTERPLTCNTGPDLDVMRHRNKDTLGADGTRGAFDDHDESARRWQARRSDANHLGFSKAATIKRHGLGFDGGQVLRGEVAEENLPEASGTSIFDPVLCELTYQWFSPPGGLILDPFAGGSVRGVVASHLNRNYIGIDLSERQLKANREQGLALCKSQPTWIQGDSIQIPQMDLPEVDLIFSCPPYGDLEVYSDHPADISNMPHSKFIDAYGNIVRAAVERLRMHRFACFVVGDFRDSKGIYRNFVSDTIAAFIRAGCQLYNEGILVTQVGSLPIRVTKQFVASRKLGKTHQNYLCFVKGDPKLAAQACGDLLHED